MVVLNLVRPVSVQCPSHCPICRHHGRIPVAAVDALLLAADAEAVFGPAPLFDVAPPLAHPRHRAKGKQTIGTHECEVTFEVVGRSVRSGGKC